MFLRGEFFSADSVTKKRTVPNPRLGQKSKFKGVDCHIAYIPANIVRMGASHRAAIFRLWTTIGLGAFRSGAVATSFKPLRCCIARSGLLSFAQYIGFGSLIEPNCHRIVTVATLFTCQVWTILNSWKKREILTDYSYCLASHSCPLSILLGRQRQLKASVRERPLQNESMVFHVAWLRSHVR